jgi:transposase
MASHQARGKYTTEFKLEAVRQVKSGQAISIVSRVLNVPKASLGNWVRQDRGGEFWALPAANLALQLSLQSRWS